MDETAQTGTVVGRDAVVEVQQNLVDPLEHLRVRSTVPPGLGDPEVNVEGQVGAAQHDPHPSVPRA